MRDGNGGGVRGEGSGDDGGGLARGGLGDGGDEDPEQVGKAFSGWAIAQVESQAISLGEVLGVSKGDERVVADKPKPCAQPCKWKPDECQAQCVPLCTHDAPSSPAGVRAYRRLARLM